MQYGSDSGPTFSSMHPELPPHLLLLELHGVALRLVSQSNNYQGLAQAARALRAQGKVDNSTAKRLAQLDTVAGWVRHITQARSR